MQQRTFADDSGAQNRFDSPEANGHESTPCTEKDFAITLGQLGVLFEALDQITWPVH
jgi:hypothetical protein